MKTVDPRISTHVRSEVTTLCTCWELTRLDGDVRRWTDHDEEVVFGGNTYEAASSGGFDRTAIESVLGMDVSNLEVVGFIGTGLSRDELDAGLYDGAALNVMLINWAQPDDGPIVMRSGKLGEVTVSDTDMYKVELRGLQQPYKQRIGEVYTPECRANFGDARCGLNLADYTATAAVLSVSTRKVFRLDTLAGDPDITSTLITLRAVPPGQWEQGVVKFTSGANAGKTIETKTITAVVEADTLTHLQIELKFAAPNEIAPTDTVEVISGCDKSPTACKGYNNMVNFRGEPFLPGENAVFKVLAVR